MKKGLINVILGMLSVLLVILGMTPARAIDPADKATFDQILQPVLKIYGFVQYAATVIAALFLVFAAISYMTSGADQKKRDSNKFMIASIVFGLIIIWATPFLINFILGQ